MNPEIFRQYDIRGIAGKDLNEADVVLLGRGIGTYLSRQGQRLIAVGRDCRLTSDDYAQRLMEGLLASGCQVVDIGVCPTPVAYFAIRHLKTQGCVMVTASHNPPEYNGFKICSGVDSVFGEQIQQIRELIQAKDFVAGQGGIENYEILPDYVDYLVENISLSRPLRVGIDAGNGTAGLTAVPVIANLGCELHELYTEMDGTFPHHEADPTVAGNMADLVALVKEKQLDVGLGFDGDGDRLGVVDADGRLIYGDQLMILFSREILARKPGATIISEVKCSQTLYDDIAKHGGQAVMYKTGHSMIKQKMKESHAELAGEMSGHLFFADRYFGYDDATYAACRLLEILADEGKNIGELLADVPQTFNTPEIRVDCPDDIKFDVVARVTEYFSKREKVIDIDGARVLFDGGWGLVRASNTQPVLVLRFEAVSPERLNEIRHTVEEALENIKAKSAK
ncbi:MAG: phosphomannomutase/phosphoglucomutase [Desulfobacterales bacterium]|nr:phosphomannomutase/phosphoglucomutase [Desulfobacterales bacterium]